MSLHIAIGDNDYNSSNQLRAQRRRHHTDDSSKGSHEDDSSSDQQTGHQLSLSSGRPGSSLKKGTSDRQFHKSGAKDNVKHRNSELDVGHYVY